MNFFETEDFYRQQSVPSLETDSIVECLTQISEYFDQEINFAKAFLLKSKSTTQILLINKLEDIFIPACSELINNNAVTQAAGTTTKSSELLDRYCDTLLRKGNQSIEETGLKVKIPSHNGATMHFKI
ncbi:unnamed protein product [Rotaria sp. Silwood1]|nr:unnamed protein product [Rotaria sp. Silwood1]